MRVGSEGLDLNEVSMKGQLSKQLRSVRRGGRGTCVDALHMRPYCDGAPSPSATVTDRQRSGYRTPGALEKATVRQRDGWGVRAEVGALGFGASVRCVTSV